MKSAVQKWVEKAQYDLGTARTLLGAGRHLYVLFCCQQAVEKMLKALILELSGEFPPRIHNLPRLLGLCGLNPPEERIEFLAELSAFYIQTRYPEEIEALEAETTQKEAEEVFRKTEEIISWLSSMLK